jgi:deoxyribonuclease-1
MMGQATGTVRMFVFRVLLAISTAYIGLSVQNVQALSLSGKIPYYGNDFYQAVAAGTRDEDLVQELRQVLESRHQRVSGGFDQVGAKCDTAQRDCYQHTSVGYSTARRILMGQIHLQNNAGNYSVKDVYCEIEFTNRHFGGAEVIGPGKIPKNSMLNTEHTWPQSRFNSGMGKDVQKSDLHHLYPTQSEMNSIRGNHKFGDVAVPDRALPCSTSKYGTANGSSEDIFEPPVAHKGNVARALFYFSVRYRLKIDPREEAFLRKWHTLDPVDAEEVSRNEQIYKVQGNRNPFIDHPELMTAIGDF